MNVPSNNLTSSRLDISAWLDRIVPQTPGSQQGNVKLLVDCLGPAGLLEIDNELPLEDASCSEPSYTCVVVHELIPKRLNLRRGDT